MESQKRGLRGMVCRLVRYYRRKSMEGRMRLNFVPKSSSAGLVFLDAGLTGIPDCAESGAVSGPAAKIRAPGQAARTRGLGMSLATCIFTKDIIERGHKKRVKPKSKKNGK